MVTAQTARASALRYVKLNLPAVQALVNFSMFTPSSGRVAAADQVAGLRARAATLPAHDLTPRQICDLEMLLVGAFAPLDGFLGAADYASVCADMRLADGSLWPIPVTLDVPAATADQALAAGGLGLRDAEGVTLAVLDAPTAYTPDRSAEAAAVYGTTDPTHPGVEYLFNRTAPVYLGGRVLGLELPRCYDFRALRRTPAELRSHFTAIGAERVVGFQTRNPLHRAHYELTLRAAREADAHLLIHPVVGLTKPGDIDHYTRVRCYQHALGRYPAGSTTLALLNLAMRMAGPREALWHALIRRNYGCTHFIVGRDHAGPGNRAGAKPFYGPFDAQQLVRRHEGELDIRMLAFEEIVYVRERARYVATSEVAPGETVLSLSGAELRRRLSAGEDIPDWFTWPEVAAELRASHPPRNRQGFTVFFTGLSGAGKSTIANVLLVRLLEQGGRNVTLLDGDVVRKHLSSELGFSREHRDLNVRRIGYVAREVNRHGGVAICAQIAPYADARRAVRELIESCGVFIEVHVSTPIEVCEKRDRKGLYALARAGKIQGFTGISDPYEIPERPELRIDAAEHTPDAAADLILARLRELRLIG